MAWGCKSSHSAGISLVSHGWRQGQHCLYSHWQTLVLRMQVHVRRISVCRALSISVAVMMAIGRCVAQAATLWRKRTTRGKRALELVVRKLEEVTQSYSNTTQPGPVASPLCRMRAFKASETFRRSVSKSKAPTTARVPEASGINPVSISMEEVSQRHLRLQE